MFFGGAILEYIDWPLQFPEVKIIFPFEWMGSYLLKCEKL